MKKTAKLIVLFFIAAFVFSCSTESKRELVVTAADQPEAYLKLLEGKRVAFTGNQTSVVGDEHIVDYLVSKGVNVVKVFAPEHGFRNMADAGAKVNHSVDEKTGIPIVSLYGTGMSKPTPEYLADVDVLLFDIQDVGCRFYTYINTMQRIMEAGGENNIPVIVLDRPNPNGFFIDGAVLEPECKSGIGYQPVPIAYGMTIGEYALMLNGEGWMKDSVRCDLTVIPLKGYDHSTRYEVPILPSPNLPNARSINLFASLCYFEGTPLSEGRGTTSPFEVFGSPLIDSTATNFWFVPVTSYGDIKPKNKDQKSWGLDLRNIPEQAEVNLEYILWAYKNYADKENFFLNNNNEKGSRNFALRAGNYELQKQIEAGMTAEEIKATWQPGIEKFKEIRKKYLLYKDFE